MLKRGSWCAATCERRYKPCGQVPASVNRTRSANAPRAGCRDTRITLLPCDSRFLDPVDVAGDDARAREKARAIEWIPDLNVRPLRRRRPVEPRQLAVTVESRGEARSFTLFEREIWVIPVRAQCGD